MMDNVPQFELNNVPIRPATIGLNSPNFDYGALPNYNDFTTLGRFLRKCMRLQAGDNEKGDGFMPLMLLKHILTADVLKQELRKQGFKQDVDVCKFVNAVFGLATQESHGLVAGNVRKERFLLISAILALMDRIPDIGKFVDGNDLGICDQDLPLLLSEEDGSSELRCQGREKSTISCLKEWRDCMHQIFHQEQWRLLTPMFDFNHDDTIQELQFDTKVILPWCDVQSQSIDAARTGGYSSVKKVKIHPLCHNFYRRLEAINVSGGFFAIKTLNHTNSIEFAKEVKMLKKFNGLVHPHLVTLLGTYKHRGEFNMIFPWAECDVDQYWENVPNPPVEDVEFVRWVADQAMKVMGAVDVIHHPPKRLHENKKESGRHGDIKSENLLWFQSGDEGGRGTWVISDLGLCAFNSDKSRSMIPNQSIKFTPAYRPPECDIDGGVISRAYDIWCLGCFYLEMICWLLGGWALKQQFQRERTTLYIHGTSTDIFFDLQLDPDDRQNGTFIALVKPKVAEMMNKLHNHRNCTDYIHRFLDIIEKEMLVVVSVDEKRSRSPVLLKELTRMHTKCLDDPNYCMIKTPKKFLYRTPTGTLAKLSEQAMDMVSKNHMQARLTRHISERPVHRSLTREQLMNLDENS